MVIFYDVTRRLLNQRLQMVRQGQTPLSSDLRHFFYECRNLFLRENPQLMEIDSKAIKEQQYANWENGSVNQWAKKHSEELGIPPELYWRVRELLGIRPEARAICEGESGKFLVDHKNRERTASGCSFILICEKKTVSEELLARLRSEGFKVNLVSTGGQNTSDVQEAVLKAVEGLDEDTPTFYVLVLHDYDLSGLRFYFTLKQRYAGVLDCGVNRELIQYWKDAGNYDARLVEEQTLNKNYQGNLKELIEENDSAYTLEDFDYLQGQQQPDGKTWIGKRIEIDAVHVAAGIEPFVKYIINKIETECKQWDLTRIGIHERGLFEPNNPFDDALNYFNQTVSEKCNTTVTRIFEPLTNVRNFVKDVTSEFAIDYVKLCQDQGITNTEQAYEDGTWVYNVNREDIEELKQKYEEGFNRQYVPDYTDPLNELNVKIHSYQGDVTTATEDVNREYEELQDEVNDAASDDDEAAEFSDELDQINWNEEGFDELPIPDEKLVIRTVIEKLTEQLKKLENNGHSDADSEGESHA